MHKVAQQRGVTFLELIIIMGVFSVLVGIGIPSYQGMRRNITLKNAALELVDTLRTAQHRAVTSQDGTKHGVYVQDTEAILFGGDTYMTRTYEVHNPFPSGIQLDPVGSPPIEVNFDHLTGATSATTITIGVAGTLKVITITASGSVSVS